LPCVYNRPYTADDIEYFDALRLEELKEAFESFEIDFIGERKNEYMLKQTRMEDALRLN